MEEICECLRRVLLSLTNQNAFSDMLDWNWIVLR